MPLRDGFPTCPVCTAALDPDPDDRKLTCRRCTGGFVTEAEVSRVLAELLHHGEPAPLPLEPATETAPVRTCPRCTSAMTKHALHGIEIDRCEVHGIWFDADEMQRVLHEAGMVPVKRERFRENLKAVVITAAFVGAQLIQFLFA